jgi:predicted nucleic acid-binding protein
LIVVDTNVVAYLLIEGDQSDMARAVWSKDRRWIMPAFWRSEFLNVLTTSLRSGVLTMRDAQDLWQLALTMFDKNEVQPTGRDILNIAAERKLSAYDAQFAAAAADLHVPLVTFDRGLLKACPDLAIAPEHFTAS